MGQYFSTPKKSRFGTKYRRRTQKKRVKHISPEFKKEKNPVFETLNITDAPTVEKTVTLAKIEDSLVRPIFLNPDNKNGNISDALLSTVSDVNKNEKSVYKSEIMWLNSSLSRQHVSAIAIRNTPDLNKTKNNNIAEDRSTIIELSDEPDHNLDYSVTVDEDPKMLTYSDTKPGRTDKNENNITITHDPPSTPSLAHIPIYLELPVEECPRFCIQVKVEITRMGRGMGASCRSSTWCRRRRRRR